MPPTSLACHFDYALRTGQGRHLFHEGVSRLSSNGTRPRRNLSAPALSRRTFQAILACFVKGLAKVDSNGFLDSCQAAMFDEWESELNLNGRAHFTGRDSRLKQWGGRIVDVQILLAFAANIDAPHKLKYCSSEHSRKGGSPESRQLRGCGETGMGEKLDERHRVLF